MVVQYKVSVKGFNLISSEELNFTFTAHQYSWNSYTEVMDEVLKQKREAEKCFEQYCKTYCEWNTATGTNFYAVIEMSFEIGKTADDYLRLIPFFGAKTSKKATFTNL